MGAVPLVGRLLVAVLFLSSAAQKLSTFNFSDGGPTMDLMAPKLDKFISSVEHFTGQTLHVPREAYVYALGIAIGLELAGGILFILGSQLGALMLIAFLGLVTPIMHDFWNQKEGSEAQITEMIQAFKNLALLGALLVIASTPRRARMKL
mmetsp:Transcript_17159/g.51342  ORF Transcript_17159/g.51342 Transcript_17159/m.51342 type:complete len:150 (+) Transcript_17159:243-692(+)